MPNTSLNMNGCLPELSLGRGCESQTHSCSKRMTKNQGWATFSTVGLTLVRYWYTRSDCKVYGLCVRAFARGKSVTLRVQGFVTKTVDTWQWFPCLRKGNFHEKSATVIYLVSDSDFPKTATVIFLSKSQWRWFDPKKEIFRRDQQIDYYYI